MCREIKMIYNDSTKQTPIKYDQRKQFEKEDDKLLT